MLQALRPNQQRQAVSAVMTIPPPIGGLNSRDPLAHMPETDAITLDNYFPGINTVSMRNGYSSYATGLGSSYVQTLMTYRALNGSEKFFGGANNNIYEITNSGASSSVKSTGITVNKWQYVNFSNSAGLWILAVNGTDSPLRYGGTNWSVNSITGSVASSAKTMINIATHKERVWLIEKNTLNAWYLASQSISGTATKLPLGGVFNNGGQILAAGTFSINDSGDGMDDMLCFVTDNGEAAVYSGTNPATDFLLVGRYDIGQAIGNRCLFSFGGDLMVITNAGVISMKQVMISDRSQEDKRAITAKIAPTFNAAARNYLSNFGWSGTIYPKGGMAVINVPEVEGSKQLQYVQNTITGAWGRFVNMNANCWGVYNDNLYFGGNAGVVYKADTGNTDNSAQIEAEMVTAFNYCGSPGQNKFFEAIRPQMTASGTGATNIGVDVDFNILPPASSASATGGGVAVWGSGIWGTSTWGGGLRLRQWLTVGKIGTCVAAHLKSSSLGTGFSVNGFDVLYQKTRGTVF